MNVLFICNQNQHRSKTAERIFKHKFETRSAGLYNIRPVTEKEISWADAVLVMEDSQRSEIAQRFPKLYMQKRIISLDIPDTYIHDDPELVKLLHSRMEQLFEPIVKNHRSETGGMYN